MDVAGLVHRARRARTAALRVELAMTGAQILFWGVLAAGLFVSVGVLVAKLWRAPRRRHVCAGQPVGNPGRQAEQHGLQEEVPKRGTKREDDNG
ncbi:hypothetical protein [Mycobacterium alsense]|uniref:hypothetical protein n=1 Tax=Mycobacterium alsense TaxID=324058 RepID=UPI001041CE28|nr:hypothetical protein [Mycobacterium alsense]